MAAPFGWGLEYDVKPGMGYEGTYPSLVSLDALRGLLSRRQGLYVGMHDKQGHHKHLAVKAREDAVGVTCTHWPSDADTADGRYSPQFDVVVGTFDGDYWNAAQIYRAFNHETPWGGNGDGLRLNEPEPADARLAQGHRPLAHARPRAAQERRGVPQGRRVLRRADRPALVQLARDPVRHALPRVLPGQAATSARASRPCRTPASA